MDSFSFDPRHPPASFRYGERSSADFFAACEFSESHEDSPGGSLHHYVYSDRAGGLRVTAHVRTFEEFHAVDWVLELENIGAADSPILADILPLDTAWAIDAGQNAYLYHAKGSQCAMDDFLPQTTTLGPRSSKTLSPVGGRSSNGVLPFMNVHHDGTGAVLAVGWSGQWQATFSRDGGPLRVAAGMQKTHLTLHGGEKIRTPRILIINYAAPDAQAGNNVLRQLLLAHYLPRIDGELFVPPVAQCLQFHYYLTGDVNAALEMQALPKVADLGATAYWIDACWYGQGRQWWQEVGNWTINRKRYPDGLRPIADAAHARGMKFVLWFEPARARRDGDLAREHPEYVLGSPQDKDNMLLNFGLKEARQHIFELFSKIIADSDVDVYREDYNFDPLSYWQAADAADRVGMTEIRYIEGHYEFWDDLRRRFPKLAIDNCASGGRRIDLEMLSRSLPLWPSDFFDTPGLPFGQGLHVGSQCVKAGLARWVPLFGGGLWDFGPYSLRSQMAGGFTFGGHISSKDFPADQEAKAYTSNDVMAKGQLVHWPKFPTALAKAAIAEWKSLRPFVLGDYYLLTPLTASYHDWCAYQFHRKDLDAGFAVFLRRHQSPFDQMHVELQGVNPRAKYKVSLSKDYKVAPSRTVTGRQLASLVVRVDDKPGSILLRYSRLKAR